MLKGWIPNLSSGTKLIALGAVAVLVPTVVLSVVQYRSLIELQGKTRAAAQENLRQYLQSFARRVKDDLQGLAKQSFNQLDPRELSSNKLDQAEKRLASISQERPEIDFLFVVSECACRGDRFALFYGPDLVRRIDDSQFKSSPEVTQIIEEYDRASAARLPLEPRQEPVFAQPPCSVFPNRRSGQPPIYVFCPLFNAADASEFGFAGMALDQRFVLDEVFPRVIPEFLRGPEARSEGSELVLAALDGNNRRIYPDRAESSNYEVKTAFAPVFPKWQLAAGYKGTTIEALARDNFRKGLLLTLSVLILLILGTALILRATTREMKLAQAKSAFVSNVSHELKTPLALIRLFGETLELGRVKNQQAAEEYYRIINSESRRLTQLIDNILDFSKIEAGRKEYRFVECSVPAVVEDVLKTYDYQLTNAGFELQVNINRSVPPASIDRDAVSQALLNLLDNAVKYSGKVKRIAVRVEQRDGHIAIEVADSGVGIPRSEQKRIFEKFHRVCTELVQNTKGSGLGLAVVKHIIEAHGGRVLVESSPGNGSRFTLLIPAIRMEAAVRQARSGERGYGVAEGPNN